MEKKNKKVILFDFDGVLVNTLEFSYKIHKRKNPNFTWERFQSYSDGNFHDGYTKAVESGEHIPTDDFPKQYKDELVHITIHDILHDAVLSLATNYNIAIISSTTSNVIKDFITQENLNGCFTDVLGMDVHTSKVVKIKSIIEKYNILQNEAVLITDTLGDIKEANECGIPSIGVTWGLHDRKTLEKGNPVTIIENPADLEGAIRNVLK